ncbi:allantoinase [Weizmannia acidilactici]|uniref:Allantoinase n=1 Tax=Weizmannia acidilactici TaxID=2607726 RepID=A0A5J4JEJ3_9BACI|nr:allantoinase [Weizmannia acidilactici]GER67607.1 allantoinase [Weizmannia acidilactici]GER69829.1 allantoinase [Weizmannia acidilactici]GER73694.1 allantoinase [Weizmannia acidilactici]
MANYDLLLRNGFIVLPDEVKQADIAVIDGKIVRIGPKIPGNGQKEIDAAGKYVFPGMIDIHVHFNEPGREDWEGFETGSKMIAAGGGTVFFDMPLNGIPSTVTKEALLQKAEIATQKSVTDFGLWGGLVPGNLADLKDLAESGVIGFKAFLSDSGNPEFERADDFTLLNGMKEIAAFEKILALHSESAAITDWLKQQKEQQGALSADDYLETRPVLAEAEAVERAITYAKLTGCALHFVHISSEAAIQKIEAAKQEGVDVTVETCPHYLLFTHDDLDEKGAVAKCAPPLRQQEEQEKLIQLFIEGKFDMIASDHSPCPYALKDPAVHSLFEAWGGISGGQFTLLSAIELAKKHDIPLTNVAKWTAENPAKRFGLSGKGSIAEGKDADFAVVALDETFTVSEENFFAKHKQSLYTGHTFPCKISMTLSNGEVIYEEGHFKERKGKWLVPQESAFMNPRQNFHSISKSRHEI